MKVYPLTQPPDPPLPRCEPRARGPQKLLLVFAGARPIKQIPRHLGLFCVLLTGLVSLGCDRQWPAFWTAPPEGTAAAPINPVPWDQQPTVRAQGTLLPASGVLRMMGTPGDRIEEVLVEPGQHVMAGEQLVRLASDRARQDELQLLDERVAEAEQTWTLQITEADETIAQARRAVQQAELAQRHAIEQANLVSQAQRSVETARRPLQRMEQAAQDPATRTLVSAADLDRQRLAVEQAEQQWQQSALMAQQAQEATQLAVEAAELQLDAAQRMRQQFDQPRALDVLRQQRVLLETQSQIARIAAPIDAVALRVEAKSGDSVGQLPLVELADLSQVNCYAEVHEADAPRLQPGQVVQMQSAALQQPLIGSVERIDPLVGRPRLRSPDPLAPVDFRAVGVTIRLDRESAALAARWIQLQVDVTIHTPQRDPEQPVDSVEPAPEPARAAAANSP